MTNDNWQIIGSSGEAIFGTTHQPSGTAKGVVLMAHGFKGYKDYGMFPWLAANLSNEGYVVHRFNFSHSGMLNNDGPFERLDLFEQATWNGQVEDLKILAETFAQSDLPLILFGHSRGGVAALLAVGRGEVEASQVISLSAPSNCLSMTEEAKKKLLEDGRIESPSGRTGQMLYVGKVFLEEQLASPESHDLISMVSDIDTPCLIIHGEEDPTVPVLSGITLSETIPNATLQIIQGGDHVFNTPNPFSVDGEPSQQLNQVWDAMQIWL